MIPREKGYYWARWIGGPLEIVDYPVFEGDIVWRIGCPGDYPLDDFDFHSRVEMPEERNDDGE